MVGKQGLMNAFNHGVELAKKAFKQIQDLKAKRAQPKLIAGQPNLKQAKHNFQYIKTCRAYGNMTIPKVVLDDLPTCDCNPNSLNPCSNDDCMNRVLKYECNSFIFLSTNLAI